MDGFRSGVRHQLLLRITNSSNREQVTVSNGEMKKFYHEQTRTNTNSNKISDYGFVRLVWFVVNSSSVFFLRRFEEGEIR